MLKIIIPLIMFILLKNSIWIIYPLIIILIIITTPLIIPLENNILIIRNIFIIDILSAPLVILTIWVSISILLVSYKIFYTNSSTLLFIKRVTTLLITLILVFSTNNIILFYIIFEISLIPTLLLILIWGYQPERIQASIYIIIYTITARLPLLINISILFINNPHLNIFILIWNLITPFPPILWWTLCLFAFIVKLPLYSTHLWLPKAHVEAPVAGSIILAGILLKLGGYGILRLSYIFQQITHSLTNLFTPIALWGAILTRFICTRQTDLKAIIAYSSIAHIGIIVRATITSTTWAWNSTLIIIIAHGICSPALFALANITYEKSNTRRVILTKGFITIIPIITLWWFIFTASNIAAPPFINLLREIILICSLLSRSLIFIPTLFILSFIVVVYSLHLFTLSQHGHAPLFSNSYSPISKLNILNNLFLFIPLLLLIIKVDSISAWI